jgi:hypothetical protein
VRLAERTLESALREVGEKFDIGVHWRFDREGGDDHKLFLSITTPEGGLLSHEFPQDTLDDEDAIRAALWSPLWHLGAILSGEVKRELERIRRGLQDLVTVPEE